MHKSLLPARLRPLPQIEEQRNMNGGSDIHPQAKEDDIAERIVAHLPPLQIPCQSEQNENPKNGDLIAKIRKQQRRQQPESQQQPQPA